MAIVRDFEELRVFQVAFAAADRVYELSKRFPAEERYSLTNQIRRSSRSVCTNIAEAWRKRRYPLSFVSKLSDSDAEAAETHTWLLFARRCGFISDDERDTLINDYRHICAQLTKMMKSSDQWCNLPKPEDPRSEQE